VSFPMDVRMHSITNKFIRTAFLCPHDGCGRSFSVLSNMRRHARVHTASEEQTNSSMFAEEGFEGPVSLSAAPSYDNLRVGEGRSPTFRSRGHLRMDDYDDRPNRR
jgi:hypothetical protein